MKSWTGSSRYHSSINMYVYKPKYSSVFAHFWGISPLILNLDIRWSSVVSFMPRLLFLMENPCYASNGRRGGPQNEFGCFWRREKTTVIVVIVVIVIPHLSNSAYFYVILGHKFKRLKFENCFTNWGICTGNLAHVLDRRAGMIMRSVAVLQIWRNLILGRDVRIVISSVLRFVLRSTYLESFGLE